MTVMIALVGEQPLPNFLPALHYTPTHVLLIHTEKTRPQFENLKTVLKQKQVKVSGVKTEEKIEVFGVETDPYDISAIVSAINEELAQNKKLTQTIETSSQSLMFNLTGGTKIMSLAAYQVAVQRNAPVIYLQSEKGQSLLDFYSWQNDQLRHESQEELPEYLNLQDMLDIHLGQGQDKWHIRSKDRKDPGILFELLISQMLQYHGYEVLDGVSDHRNQIDIDVIMRCQNHVVIIEAKTKSGKKDRTFDGIQQLSTNMRYLGGTYTIPFLVANYELTDEQQQSCKLMRIRPISLLHYQQQMTTLPQEDIDTLLTTIHRAIKPEKKAEIK